MKDSNEIFNFINEFYYRFSEFIYLEEDTNEFTFIESNSPPEDWLDFISSHYYLGHTDDIYMEIESYESLVASWIQLHDKRKDCFTFHFNNKTYQINKEKLYSKIIYNKLTPAFKKYVDNQLEKYKPIYELHCVTNFIDNSFRDVYLE